MEYTVLITPLNTYKHMFKNTTLNGLAILFFLISNSVFANIIIGVVGKTKNDSFYQQSYKGCQKFAELHLDVTCLYDGPLDYQDIRSQTHVINDLVTKGIDALLVSTTDSEFLVNNALKSLQEKNIPVITFDSDLMPAHKQYRLAYVGTNNFDFGKALGRYINQFRNEKKTAVCLQSGHKTTPNLNERIAGVRFALSKTSTERLTGQNGWYEHDRCPLYSLGKRKRALHQLQTIIKQDKPPIFLAVAGFAQFNPHYVEQIAAFKKRIESNEITIVSADTEQIQLDALKAGLSVANIGQKPFEMGRRGAELLYLYVKNKQLPEKDNYYLDYHYCTQENSAYCTTNY